MHEVYHKFERVSNPFRNELESRESPLTRDGELGYTICVQD